MGVSRVSKKVATGQLTLVSLQDGVSSFLHRAWSNSIDGKKDFTTKFSNGMRYLGTYTSTDSRPSEDSSKYDWTPLFDNVLVGNRNLIRMSRWNIKSKKGQSKIIDAKFSETDDKVFKLDGMSTYALTLNCEVPYGYIEAVINDGSGEKLNETLRVNHNGSETLVFKTESVETTDATIEIFDRSEQGGNTLIWGVLSKSNIGSSDWFPAQEDIDAANKLNKDSIVKLNKSLEDLKVGGRNLWVESNLEDGILGKDGVIQKANSQFKSMKNLINVKPNDTLIYQIWNPKKIINNKDKSHVAFFNGSKWISDSEGFGLTGEEYELHFIKVPKDTYKARLSAINGAENYDSSIKIKFENGNRPTDWLLAPEDTINATEGNLKQIAEIKETASSLSQKLIETSSGVNGLNSKYSLLETTADGFKREILDIKDSITKIGDGNTNFIDDSTNIYKRVLLDNKVNIKVLYKLANGELIHTETKTGFTGKQSTIRANVPQEYSLKDVATKTVSVGEVAIEVEFTIAPIIIQSRGTVYYKFNNEVIKTEMISSTVGSKLNVRASAPKNYSIVGETVQNITVRGEEFEVNFKLEKIPAKIHVSYKATKESNKVVSSKIIDTFMGDRMRVNGENPTNYHITGQNFKEVIVESVSENVIFDVERNATTINIEYYSNEERKLVSSDTQYGLMGDDKVVSATNIPLGYVLVGSNKATINLNSESVTHRFIIIKKKDEPAQVRTVYYISETSKYLFGETINTFIEKTVTVKAQVPDGYLLDEDKDSKTIKVTKAFEDVTFNIKLKPKVPANITVNYVTESKGVPVKHDTIKAFVGDLKDINGTAPSGYEIVGRSDKSVMVSEGGATVEFIIQKIKAMITVEYYSEEESRVVFRETIATHINESVEVSPKDKDGYILVDTHAKTIVVNRTEITHRFNIRKKPNKPSAQLRVLFFDLYEYNYLSDQELIDTFIGETVKVAPKVPNGYKFQDETEKMVQVNSKSQDVLFNVLSDSSSKSKITVRHVDKLTDLVMDTDVISGRPNLSTRVISKNISGYEVIGESSANVMFESRDTTYTFYYRGKQKEVETRVIIEYSFNSNVVHSETSTGIMGQTKTVVGTPPSHYRIKGSSTQSRQIRKPIETFTFEVEKILVTMTINYRLNGRNIGTSSHVGYEGDEVSVKANVPDGYKINGIDTKTVRLENGGQIYFDVLEIPKKPSFDSSNSYIKNGEMAIELSLDQGTSLKPYNLTQQFRDIVSSSYQDLEIVFTIEGSYNSSASFALTSREGSDYTKQYKYFSEIKLPNGRYGARFPFYSDYKNNSSTTLCFDVQGLGFNDEITIKDVTLKHVDRDNSETELRSDLTLFSSGFNGSFEKIGTMEIDDRFKEDKDMTFSLYGKPKAEYYLRVGIIDETGKETFKDSISTSEEGYIQVTTEIKTKWDKVNIYLGNSNKDNSNEILYKHLQAEFGKRRTNWSDGGDDAKALIKRIAKLEHNAQGLESVISSKIVEGMDEIREWADSRIAQTDKSISGMVSTEKSYGGFSITEDGARLSTPQMDLRMDSEKGFEIIKKSKPAKTIFQIDKDGIMTFNATGGTVTGGTSGNENKDLYQAWSDSSDGSIGFTKNPATENLLDQNYMVMGYTDTSIGSNVTFTAVDTGFYLVGGKKYTLSLDLKEITSTSNPITISVGSGMYAEDFQYEIINNVKAHTDKRTVITFTPNKSILESKGKRLCFKINNGGKYVELKYGQIKLEEGYNTQATFTSTPKYVGFSVKDSNNNIDYRWSLNPSYVDSKTESLFGDVIRNGAYQEDIKQVYEDLSSKADLQSLKDIENMTKTLQEQYSSFVESGGRYSTDLEALEKRTAALVANMGEQVARYEFISKYITMGQEGLLIGDSTSLMKILVSNDKISFIDSGQEIAYMKGQEFKINRGTILESLQVGKHRMEQLDDDNTVFRFIS